MAALANAKHERFCQEYVVDLNATQAYIRAGYAAKGADRNAWALMGNQKVRERIEEIKTERAKSLNLTQESVLYDLERIKHLAVRDGQLGAAVRATELHGKHLGLFPSRHELTGPGGGPIILSDTERAAKAAAILSRAAKRKEGAAK